MDAGDVRIGIDLDAGDLGARLGAAVRSKLGPVLASIQADAAKTNAKLDQLGNGRGAGRISSAMDSARQSMSRAAAAASKLADDWTKSENRRASSSEDAARRIARSATPSFGGGRGGGGGGSGGGGGGGGGGRRGGGRRGPNPPADGGLGDIFGRKDYTGVIGQASRMWDEFLAKTVLVGSAVSTLTPAIGLLGGAIGVLGGGIGIAVGGIGQLAVGVTALGPAIGSAVLAIKTGFSGLKEGAKAYMAQFDDANKVISAQIGNMMGPMLTAWQEVSSRIKLDFAQALVPSFNNLAALIRGMGPGLQGINQAFASVANNFTGALLAAGPQLAAISNGAKTLISTLGPGLANMAIGFVNMGAAAQQAMPAIAGAMRGVADQLAATFNQLATSPVFQQALQGFAAAIQGLGPLLSNVFLGLTQAAAQVGPMLGQLFAALGPALNQLLVAFGQLAQTAGPAFIQVITALGPALSQVVGMLGQLAASVGPTLVPLINALVMALQPFVPALAQLGQVLGTQLAQILPTVGTAIASIAGPIATLLPTAGTLINVLAQGLIAIQPLLTGLAGGIGQLAAGLTTGLSALMPGLNAIAQALGPILNQLGAALGQALASLGPPLNALLVALAPIAQIMGQVLVSAVQTLAAILQPLSAELTTIFTALGQVLQQNLPSITGIIQQLGQVLPSVIQQLMPAVNGVMQQLGPAVTTIASAFAQFLPVLVQVGQNFMTSLAPVLPVIVNAFTQLWQTTAPLIPQFADLVAAGLQPMMQAFAASTQIIQPFIPLIMQLAQTAIPMMVQGLQLMVPVLQQIISFMTQMAQMASTGMTTMIDAAVKGMNLLITLYNNTVKPIMDAMHSVGIGPAGPTIGPVTAPTLGGGGGFGGFHMPGVPGGIGASAGGVLPPALPGIMTPAVPGGLPPTQFAPPGASTPVAPDIKGSGAGDNKLSPDQIPLDQAVRTPEQLALLTEIRNLLAGTGRSGAPLNTLKDMGPAVQLIAEQLKQSLPNSMLPPGSTPSRIGPFGTPIPARNPGWEMANAFIQSLGGQPENFIGPNPIDYATKQWGQRVDDWKSRTDYQIQQWQNQLQNNPMMPGQMGTLPGMPPGWQPTNLPSGAAGAPAAGGKSLWDAVAQAEASGDWQNMKNPTHFGGLQFSQDTWNAFGGTQFAQNPAQATREQQIEIANRTAFTGWQGQQPQGLKAWEAITKGMVPGVTENTPASAFGVGAPGSTPLLPTAPGLPGMNIGTTGNPVPVWIVGSGPMAGGMGGLGGLLPSPTGAPGVGAGVGASWAAGGMDARSFAHDVMQPIWERMGLTVGDHAADQFGEHQHGALDVMVPSIQVGQQVLQQALQDPNVYGAIFNNQTFGYGHGTTPQDYSAGHTGDPSQDHTNHVHIWYKPGDKGDITPGAMPAGMTGAMPGMPGVGSPGMPGAGGAMPGGIPVNSSALASGAGTPVFVTNWPGQGQGGLGGLGGPMAQQAMQGMGSALGQVGADVAGALPSALFGDLPNAPAASNAALVKEGNPLALAAMAGFDVPDFSRAGGSGPGDVTRAGGFDASGRMFSDTAAMLDRTFTALSQQIEAMKNQLLQVMQEIASRLSEKGLQPVVEQGVAAGFSGVAESVFTQAGGGLGTTAGPVMADAVASAVSGAMASSGGGSGIGDAVSGIGGGLTAGLFDEGGMWPSGTIGANLSGSYERVLNPSETQLFNRGLYGGWNVGQFATKKGEIGNATVGAEWFGVSEIPIISTIINLLVRVLLQVLGVEIETRDTLNEMTDTFRQFRGDSFKAFDAQGRLINDTSAMMDRSFSSEQAVADERIRILKIVLQALVKYIIEKVIVPMIKAVANAVIQAGSSAAGMAINTQAPGAGSIASAVMSSAGQAGVEIFSEVASDFAVSFSQVIIDMVGEGLQTAMPDLMTGIFGGDMLGGLFGPFTMILDQLLGGFLGGFASLFASLLGGAVLGGATMPFAGVLGGLFDSGGTATGAGYLPKATLEPERVLSPTQTTTFDRMVAALESGKLASRSTTIHAPFTVVGGRQAGEDAHDRLLALLS